MLDAGEQRRLLRRLVEAARAEGLFVAPVGSVYYLFHDAERAMTKDLDAVLHGPDLAVADTEVLRRVGQRIGQVRTTHDGAVVAVHRTATDDEPILELVRGRKRPKGGFMPRGLLEYGARLADRQDDVLVYPREVVLVLKADAAVDRAARAEDGGPHAMKNRLRAEVFRRDCLDEAARLMEAGGPDTTVLETALALIKAKRREPVKRLLQDAGVTFTID